MIWWGCDAGHDVAGRGVRSHGCDGRAAGAGAGKGGFDAEPFIIDIILAIGGARQAAVFGQEALDGRFDRVQPLDGCHVFLVSSAGGIAPGQHGYHEYGSYGKANGDGDKR